ncbi:hypothetical protein PG997_007150 [Apiospora hydei]|uniref:Uncharacterized protein n=1 Tax=Apiospora hydei TaxID=1337664 RepID=A0ABR1WSB5_9PEZI
MADKKPVKKGPPDTTGTPPAQSRDDAEKRKRNGSFLTSPTIEYPISPSYPFGIATSVEDVTSMASQYAARQPDGQFPHRMSSSGIIVSVIKFWRTWTSKGYDDDTFPELSRPTAHQRRRPNSVATAAIAASVAMKSRVAPARPPTMGTSMPARSTTVEATAWPSGRHTHQPASLHYKTDWERIAVDHIARVGVDAVEDALSFSADFSQTIPLERFDEYDYDDPDPEFLGHEPETANIAAFKDWFNGVIPDENGGSDNKIVIDDDSSSSGWED